MRHAALAILLAVPLTILGGCSSYKAPRLSVTDALVNERTPEGVRIEFAIDAVNPNDVPIPLETIRYRLTLDGRTVFSGERAAMATIARSGTAQLTLPAVIPASDTAGLVGEKPYRLSGEIVYVTPGEIAQILFDYKIRRPTAGFSDRGVLDFGVVE